VEAFKNMKFLTGDEARGIRILCEYVEPKTRLRAEGITRGIIFFGSARVRKNAADPDSARYYRDAADLAERLARWTLATHAPRRNYHICTGGGPGIMEAAHEGAARVHRKLNVGLSIALPNEQIPNTYLDRERDFDFHYFFMRKFWFMNLAEAFVIFPGGFGTFDELFEVLTLMQTRRSVKRPTVLFDAGFWRDTVNFEGFVRRGLINAEDLSLFHFSDTVGDAFEFLSTALPK
jgi:uncharacterized protein (TIGR00730 family)